jgi:hypothetical protein
MKTSLPLLLPTALLLFVIPFAARANDFPTTDRVEYVLECMSKHPGHQEYLYKCSCVIDKIAQKIKYDDYVELATAQRYQNMGGERGALFRETQDVKSAAKNYKTVEEAAQKSCFAN